MSDEHFINAQQAMNLVQLEIFVNLVRSVEVQMNISEHMEWLFITGESGTGKTVVFNIL